MNNKHGESKRGSWTKEYKIWKSIKRRCYDENNVGYKTYGGRGIQMCDRWKESYALFLADMGRCPAGLSIGRINNAGNYEPTNCRWETIEQQSNNRRSNIHIEHAGKKQTKAQWARELGCSQAALNQRLYAGWSITRALTEPFHLGSHKQYAYHH